MFFLIIKIVPIVNISESIKRKFPLLTRVVLPQKPFSMHICNLVLYYMSIRCATFFIYIISVFSSR